MLAPISSGSVISRLSRTYFAVTMLVSMPWTGATFAQSPPVRIVPPTLQHTVHLLLTSDDGRLIAAYAAGESLKLWSARDGRLLDTLPAMRAGAQDTGTSMGAFSSDSRLLALATSLGNGSVQRIYDLALRTHKDLVMPGKHEPRQLSFSPDGAKVFVRTDKEIFCFSSSSAQLLPMCGVKPSERVVSVFSRDRSRLVSLMKDGRLVWQEVASWKTIATFSDVFAANTQLQVSHDGAVVLVEDGASRLELRFDGAAVSKIGKVQALKPEPERDVTLLGSGRFAAITGDGSLRIFDLQRKVQVFAIAIGDVHAVDFLTRMDAGSDDKLTLLVKNKIQRVNLVDGQPAFNSFRIQAAERAESVTFARSGNIALSAADGTARLFDFITLSARTFELPEGQPFLSPAGDKVVVLQEKDVLIYDIATGQTTPVQLFAPLLEQLYGVGEGLIGGFQLLASDGRRVVLWHEGEHLGAYDIDTGVLLEKARVPTGGASTAAQYNALARRMGVGPNHVAEGTPDLVHAVSAKGDLKLVLDFIDESKSKAEIVHVRTGQRVKLQGDTKGLHRAVFALDDRAIIGATGAGGYIIWDTQGKLLATVVAAADAGYITMTSEGFFSGTKPAMELISLVRGNNITRIEQIFQVLFSPDLVREKLWGDPDGEVKKAAGAVDLQKVLDSGRPPGVTIVSPLEGSTVTGESVQAAVRVEDVGGGIGRIEWRVNGVTVGIVNGLPRSANDGVLSLGLTLEPGENIVEVVAYNKRNLLSSIPVVTRINWNAPVDQPRSKLFIIAVGINAYQDNRFGPLTLAGDDARVFAAAMTAAGRGLYADVDVTIALDKEATAERLDKVITDIGARMHPRDSFIFFAAAHGKSDAGRFHLIPQDYRTVPERLLNAEATISQDKLQEWFANRLKGRRGLILLDTCESGALVANQSSGIDLGSSNAAVGRLNEATGRAVLTAAAANQDALEGYKGHGVFTYAVLNALLHGDRDGNGHIEFNELVAHVQALTPKISKELRATRGSKSAAPQKKPSLAATALGNSSITTQLADIRQTARSGSRGEDFVVGRKLLALPQLQSQHR